jgi:hypothetical protein
MGNNKSETDKDRRWFLSLFTASEKESENPEMVKMLTADGKLVQINKAVLEAVSKNKKSTNKEIFDWMDNPSKDNNI